MMKRGKRPDDPERTPQVVERENGFAGVAWCFGKHGRPWQERKIAALEAPSAE
jgi:hypothetical protein